MITVIVLKDDEEVAATIHAPTEEVAASIVETWKLQDGVTKITTYADESASEILSEWEAE